MVSEDIKQKLEEVKKSVLIVDIETSAMWPGTQDEININTNFDDYVKYAKTKWFGGYSFKDDKVILDSVYVNEESIKNLIADHKYIVGFNNESFDTPILYNCDLIPEGYFKQIDMLCVLGSSTFKRHDGLPFKNRGMYMGYKFKKNSLKHMAEVMELDAQKGDIDYKIFHRDDLTEQEIADIKKYLESDILVTKQMFEKVWDFYLPFADFLTDKDILNLSWIKSSIASLTYKASCKVLGVEPTYGEKPENSKEEMGGNVIEPKYEEARNVWYVDFASLYPHIFAQFNLFAEVDMTQTIEKIEDKKIVLWHGNDLFKVKGYYDISEQHLLSKDVAEKLKLRMEIKKQIKETGVPNSLEYAIKIFLNSLYGAARSPIFEQINTPNCGWDCCWLGQQIQKYAEDRMTDFGFETIAGDTDSIFVQLTDRTKLKYTQINDFESQEVSITKTGFKVDGIIKDSEIKEQSEKDYVKVCLKTIVDEIKNNVPFPADTFNIDIEQYVEYITWPFSDQPIKWTDNEIELRTTLEKYAHYNNEEITAIINHNIEKTQIGHNVKNLKNRLIKIRKGMKKNYLYIYDKKGEKVIKIMGMPIKKDGATLLGPKIYNEILKPLILENDRAKFPKKYIDELLEKALEDPKNLELLSREYKVKPAISYKSEGQLQAQISEGYFNGQDGIIRLIKNKKVGNAGKTAKYATVEEIVANKIGLKDLDLVKVHNELEPFVEYKNEKKYNK